MGGHSLLATQVISRLREVFSIDFPLRYLFENPTIAELAQRVIEQAENDALARILEEVDQLSEEEVMQQLFFEKRTTKYAKYTKKERRKNFTSMTNDVPNQYFSDKTNRVETRNFSTTPKFRVSTTPHL